MQKVPWVHVTTIVGYAYEADLHCLACTAQRFGLDLQALQADFETTDGEGNPVHPVFAGDVTDDVCGDCGQPLTCL